MLNLAEMMVLACENWQSKADFNAVCRPHRERPGAYHIVLNGKHFGFDGNSTPFNPLNASKLCRSKIDTIELVSQADLKTGIHIPKTRAYFDPSFYEPGVRDEKLRMFRQNTDDICADVAGVFSFPVIVKPNSKSMSTNSSLVHTADELPAALDRVFADASSYDLDAVVQERIDIQTEYRAVCFDGRSMMMIERDTSNAEPNEILNPVFWEGTRSVLVHDEELAAASEEIATFLKDKAGLRYTGFDLARDRDGQIWFIEANSAPMIAVGELLHEDEGLAAIRHLTDVMFVDMAHQAGIDLG